MKNCQITSKGHWPFNSTYLLYFVLNRITKSSLVLFCLLGIFSMYGSPLYGQTIARQVIGIAGGNAKVAQGTTISWTIGQTAVQHARSTNKDYSITEGFQQPNIQALPTHTFSNPLVNIAPNPVVDILNVKVLNPKAALTTYTLMDELGRTLLNGNFKAWSNELNLSKYPSGTYFLNVHQSDQKLNQTYKVLKIR